MRLSARLPKGGLNGLGVLAEHLSHPTDQAYLVIGVVRPDPEAKRPQLVYVEIEAITDERVAEYGHRLMSQARELRTGDRPLPGFDLDDVIHGEGAAHSAV